VYASESSEWLAPSIGEGVMLLCPNGDLPQAVALRGFYSEDFPPPSTNPNKHVRKYRDGAASSLAATLTSVVSTSTRWMAVQLSALSISLCKTVSQPCRA